MMFEGQGLISYNVYSEVQSSSKFELLTDPFEMWHVASFLQILSRLLKLWWFTLQVEEDGNLSYKFCLSLPLSGFLVYDNLLRTNNFNSAGKFCGTLE